MNIKRIIRESLEDEYLERLKKAIKTVDDNPHKVGNVYFNDKSYPGYMYVKEYLEEYKMYWISMENHKSYEAELYRDESKSYSRLYWLTSPTGTQFPYELVHIKKGGYKLESLDQEGLSKYTMKHKMFPSHTKE